MTATEAELAQAREHVFDAMEALIEATRVVQEVEGRAGIAEGTWLRADGVSIAYEQLPPNEIVWKLQVPMDSIIAAQQRLGDEQEDML